MMKNQIFELEYGGRPIHEFHLNTSWYGIYYVSKIQSAEMFDQPYMTTSYTWLGYLGS